MNTSGCDPAFARDSMFVYPGSLTEPSCTLLMPLYFLMLSIFFLLLLAVALVRTSLVLNKKRGATRLPSNSVLSSLVPWVIVSASWVSCFVIFLLIIIPSTYGTGNNVIVFLLGLEFLSFNILGERWFRKLVRLGSKIIKPILGTNKNYDASNGSSELSATIVDDKSMAYLEKTDTLLKAIDVAVILTITIQLIAMCVLAMVFPANNTWLRVGLGLHGLDCWFTALANVWQYERCSNAISSTSAGLRDVVRSGTAKHGMVAVQAKFRKHQLILITLGGPAGLVYILWGAGVIPINYILVIVTGFYDALTNCGILMTFVKRGVRKPNRSEKTKTTATSNNMLAPISVFQPAESSVRAD